MKTPEEGYALGWADAIYKYESEQKKSMRTVDDLMALGSVVGDTDPQCWSGGIAFDTNELRAAIAAALKAEYERGRTWSPPERVVGELPPVRRRSGRRHRAPDRRNGSAL